MVDYGTGTFTLANLGNPATGPDDVFQWNPGDSNTVEDHNTARVSARFQHPGRHHELRRPCRAGCRHPDTH